jgi:CheY-like chemotaxis protein
MTKPATVMIIDDDVDLLDELSDLLSSGGYRVVPCAGTASAVRIAAENRPDVIITDILMPGMNGLQLVESLRREGEAGSTPIVMMSGRCTDNEGATLVRVNRLAGFVAKPISASRLFSLLEEILS